MYKLTNHRRNKTMMIPNRNILDASDNDMLIIYTGYIDNDYTKRLGHEPVVRITYDTIG